MPGKIRLLTDEVIGKIAAGEVVERPAAAIKEMIENSLDAGATAITVEIRDGGISYFRVTDNGSGIAQSEIRMAFERHATSKIASSNDLAAIQTLGFRGEALASIAAVAKVICTTRTKQDTSGIKITNLGGQIESIEEAACPEGTSFVVRDLFFNTPVRLKFLKKPATEAGYVSDLMMRMILSRPDVSFRYINQGKTLYHSAGDGKLSSAVFSIYGKEIRSMREVNGHQAGVVVNGYIGTADNGRATRSHQSFYINGRYMKSPVLSAGVEAACREHLPSGRYPACILHLTMPFELVDVNVHPNKLECRFQNDAAIAEAVESIVLDALSERNPLEKPQVMQIVPDVSTVTPVAVKKQEGVFVEPIVKKLDERPNSSDPAKVLIRDSIAVQKQRIVPAATQSTSVPQSTPAIKQVPPIPNRPVIPASNAVLNNPAPAVQAFMQSYKREPAVSETLKQETLKTAVQEPVTQSFLPEAPKPLKIIGTAFNSYILVEYEDNLLLVDQQGVHERLLFDRMMKALGTENCSQEMLIPLIVQATRKEQQLLENHQELLQSIGLTVETFGETEIAVRAIPVILGKPQTHSFLREVIDQLEGERGIVSLEKRRSAIVAIACRKSVRQGERLQEDDVRELVVRMVEKKITPASPRGTPLIIALPRADIDRRFRRLQ